MRPVYTDYQATLKGSNKGKSVNQSVAIRMKLRPSFPMDLIVRTPEHVNKRIEMGDEFMIKVMEEGKVLYEADKS